MTLRQVAYEKMAGLSDASIQRIIFLVDEMLFQEKNKAVTSASSDNTDDSSRRAFLNILEFTNTHPIPDNIDWEKAREEALEEKYGRFD